MKPAPLALALTLAGCTGSPPDDTGETNDTGIVELPDGARTISNCGGTVASDVPDFYKTYFRCVDITMDGDTVVITTTDEPPHGSAYYAEDSPNYVPFDYSRGDEYHPNPNTLEAQNITMRVPASPVSRGLTINDAMVDLTVNTSNNEYGLGPAGVALDSVALFNSVAGPGDDIEDEKYTFDSYEAHPEQSGTYHYHSASAGPLEALYDGGFTSSTTPGSADLEVYGMMCDGSLVLGCTELDGTAPSSGDFDAQNGHVHDITDDAGTTHFASRYHTHVCSDFPDHAFTPEIQFYDSCGITGAGGPP